MFQFSEARPGEERDRNEVLAEQAIYVRQLADYVRKYPNHRKRIEEEIDRTYTRHGYPLARRWFDAMMDGRDDFGYENYLETITTPPPLDDDFVERPLTRGRSLEQRKMKVVRECDNQLAALLRYYRNEKTPGFIEEVPGVSMDPNEAQMSWFLLDGGKLYVIPKNGKHTIKKGTSFAPVGRIEDAGVLLVIIKKQMIAGHWDRDLEDMYKKEPR